MKKRTYPAIERIAKLFEDLAELQRWGDGPSIGLEIAGKKAKFVLLEEEGPISQLDRAREKRRARNNRKSPASDPPV